ncbi:MAG TPA: hypothetical protein VF773_16585 [Verrucomicrobiae bacterium]
MVESASAVENSQRVQVQMLPHPHGKRLKIRIESFDEKLGWYTSGSLMLPLHQLPLLEQAVAEMRSVNRKDEFADIIPFPGLSNADIAD